jgi:multicomponent Na+:H+ antiporter subunit F
MGEHDHISLWLYLSMGLLLIALLLTFIRLVKGPEVNDRVVALDLIASVVMGFILVYSVMTGDPFYMDIPLVIALISFIGTVAISTYLRQKNLQK